MGRDTSVEDAPEFDEVDDDISTDQAKLLATVHDADEGLPTGRLREATEIPYGSMNYHLSRLEGWGLVEVVGRRAEGSGSPSKVWETTERGHSYLARPGPAGPATFQDIMNRIADIERDIEQRDARIETLEEDVAELKNAYNELAAAVEEYIND